MALLDSPSSTSRPSRRDFLRLGGLGVAGLALVACGGDRPARHPPRAPRPRPPRSATSRCNSPGSRTSSSRGEYIADTKGYYKEAGLLEGRPAVAAARRAAATRWSCVGQGHSSASPRRTSRPGHHQQGAAAEDHRRDQYQKNPFCILSSLAQGKPISTPAGPRGQEDRRPGGTNEPVWDGVPQGQRHRPGEINTGPGAVRPDAADDEGGRRLVHAFVTNEPIL